MRITVIAAGRGRNDPAAALFDRYAGRCRFEVRLREIEARGKFHGEELRRAEAASMVPSLPGNAKIAALDERGETLDSVAFADMIGSWRENSVRDCAFLIGGADGLDAGLVERADRVVSLGRMTWPHMLVRAMLAEQLYRAETILAGHPYHRG